jgi:hypothetical protein
MLLKRGQIFLNARLAAVAFYEQLGFKGVGGDFPSEKTGILHRRMEKSKIIIKGARQVKPKGVVRAASGILQDKDLVKEMLRAREDEIRKK